MSMLVAIWFQFVTSLTGGAADAASVPPAAGATSARLRQTQRRTQFVYVSFSPTFWSG
jgi:hypothetical protein